MPACLVSEKKTCIVQDVLADSRPSPSLADFELYLAFRELSLENLQFVIWFLDYQDRFDRLPPETQRKSPDPALMGGSHTPSYDVTTNPHADAGHIGWLRRAFRRKVSARQTSVSSGKEIPMSPIEKKSAEVDFRQFHSPASSQSYPIPPSTSSPAIPSPYPASSAPTRPQDQPFREETLRVVATFFRPGGNGQKELSIDQRLRDEVLRDLAVTTHPNAVSRHRRLVLPPGTD